MIGYLDTSAFVPLLIDEPSTKACMRFWDDADDVTLFDNRHGQQVVFGNQLGRFFAVGER